MPQYDLNQILQNISPAFRGQIGRQLQPQFNNANTRYASFSGNTPFDFLNRQLMDAQYRGDGSGATSYSRQLDDLNFFNSIMGDGMNKAYQSAFGNLSQARGNAVGRAQNTAGAIAGSRGYANPGSFILGSGTMAGAPYVGAQQNLATQQLFGNQEMLMNLLRYLQAQQGMRQQQQQYEDQNSANFVDYLGAFGNLGKGIAGFF